VPFVLRQIRRSKWYKHPDVQWLEEGELQADALGDLETTHNELSVWHIQDDKSNLGRVVAALAIGNGSRNLANVDYALVDLQTVLDLDIQLVTTQGETLDAEVNSWHRDLVEMTASKLMGLASAIQTNGEKERLSPKKVASLVNSSVEEGYIDRSKLSASVLKKLG
jgi:hypothetical protein